MKKIYTALGTMSGTSMDGIDASIIQSDGETKYKVIIDKYFKCPQGIYKNLIKLRDKIRSSKDLKKFSKEVKNVEKEITLFHANTVNEILKKTKVILHGQIILHLVHLINKIALIIVLTGKNHGKQILFPEIKKIVLFTKHHLSLIY